MFQPGQESHNYEIVHNSQSIQLPTSQFRDLRQGNKQHNAQISFYIVTIPATVVASVRPGRLAPAGAYACDVGRLMVGVGLLILGGGAGTWLSRWS